MEQRRFGNTDLMTSAIGFGTWEMSTTMYGDIDVGDASNAVNAAIDRGITLFDTAEVYGPFHSEELLGKAIGSRRDEVVLVTKVGFDYDGATITGTNSTYDHVISRTEGCLTRLGTDRVDLMLIHWPDHDTAFDEPMSALEKLKADGKIRHYGVSNFNVAMMETCQRHGSIATNQVGYNLFDRRMEAEVLPWCDANDVGFMAYGSLGFGLLTGAMKADTTFVANDWRGRGTAFGLPLFLPEWMEREVRVADRLKALAADHGRSLAQMAISWVIGHPAVTVALVGMRNEAELDENVAAADWKLPDDLRASIDAVFDSEGVLTFANAPQRLWPGS
jgi:aryl-alcohol dehydrogenase-like predicted oxidoreductase